jgi:4'-phosphopantetheinyl transferase
VIPTECHPAASGLTLTRDEVHTWVASLRQPPEVGAALGAALAPDETARAARYIRAADGARFRLARGLLRHLVGAYLGRPAGEVVFAYGPHGKPALAPEHGADLRFSVAHAGDVALYALTRGREVGVDVEQIRPLDGLDAVVDWLFSERERAWLHTLGRPARLRAFFDCWTRKEAYIKARGQGFTIALRELEALPLGTLSDPPEEAPEASWARLDGRWWACPLYPAPGYAGTVVVAAPVGAPAPPALRRWPEDLNLTLGAERSCER